MSRTHGIGRWTGGEPGESWWSRFAWPAIVATLVASGISSLLDRFLFNVPIEVITTWWTSSLALDPDARTVVGLVGDAVFLLYAILGAWVGGDVARRLARGAEDLPRVARTLAWLLAGLGALGLAYAAWSLSRLNAALATMHSGELAASMRPGVERFGPLVLAGLQTIVTPLIARAAVLRVASDRRA